MFKVPILFLAYNRPEITKITIKNIKKIRPYKIYISIDGPKKNKKDKLKVQAVRKILKKFNKKTFVKTKINKTNLGCKKSNLNALNWFFAKEKMGIVIEDDCLVDKNFFKFCNLMLKKYKNNKKIYCISGSNFQAKKIFKESYYFSKYNHCWGWATWRDRWKNNDGNIKFWPRFKNSIEWKNLHFDNIEMRYWTKIFDNIYNNKIDSWAYPWTLSVWKKNGITITPTSNLVKNIGFGIDSTHAKFADKEVSYLNKSILSKNFTHPKLIKINKKADEYVFNYHFKGKNYIWPYRMVYICKLFALNPFNFIRKLFNILKKSENSI